VEEVKRAWAQYRMKFWLLVGLPGSGKSHLGKQLAEQTQGLFLDDVSRTCGVSRLWEDFQEETVIVADPSLCRSANRQFAEHYLHKHHVGCQIEWVFFENAPDQCWVNVQARHDGRIVTEHTIRQLSEHYHIPAGAPVAEVWKGQNLA
jgi:predicted kinase